MTILVQVLCVLELPQRYCAVASRTARPNYGLRGRAVEFTAGKLHASSRPHADQMEAAFPATVNLLAGCLCGVTTGKAELWTGKCDSVAEDAARNSTR